MTDLELASTIKRLREQQHLTQAELAELAGTTQGHISEYETGKKVPDWKTLIKLAVALKASVELTEGG